MTHHSHERLAEYLDTWPLLGFPKTEEGIEIQILKKFFSQEEAELALCLPLMLTANPEPSHAIAEKAEKNVKEVENILEGMVKKGVIYAVDMGESKVYALLPWAPGIFEFGAKNFDPETAELIEKYMLYDGVFAREHLKKKIPITRLVPVSQSIDSKTTIHPYEDVKQAIEEADSICLVECACRTAHNLVAEGCGTPTETCMMLNEFAVYLNEIGLGRSVTKEEAFEILEKTEAAGCIHCTSNTQGLLGICACCPCCCHALRLVIDSEDPNGLAKSDFIAQLDEALCTGCEACIEICPFKALTLEDETAMVNGSRCMGCGKCVRECPVEALVLVRKPEEDIRPTPKDYAEAIAQLG